MAIHIIITVLSGNNKSFLFDRMDTFNNYNQSPQYYSCYYSVFSISLFRVIMFRINSRVPLLSIIYIYIYIYIYELIGVSSIKIFVFVPKL